MTRLPALLAGATALVISCSAHAQNNKPIRSGTFYEDRANLVNTNLLTLQFAQAPSDKFLNITRVACRVLTTNTQTFTKAVLVVGTAAGQSDIGRTQHLILGAADKTYSNDYTLVYFVSNQQVYFKVGPGRFPSINFEAQQFNNQSTQPQLGADCTIVGDLTDN